MPDRIKDLPTFLNEMNHLLDLVNQCREVLFRVGFREYLPQAIDAANGRLYELAGHEHIQYPDQYDEMRFAGLTGPQLQLKLESFETALAEFEAEGGQDYLGKALDTGATILSSLAGAIPGFGSFAQELVDFILKELKRRLWRPW